MQETDPIKALQEKADELLSKDKQGALDELRAKADKLVKKKEGGEDSSMPYDASKGSSVVLEDLIRQKNETVDEQQRKELDERIKLEGLKLSGADQSLWDDNLKKNQFNRLVNGKLTKEEIFELKDKKAQESGFKSVEDYDRWMLNQSAWNDLPEEHQKQYELTNEIASKRRTIKKDLEPYNNPESAMYSPEMVEMLEQQHNSKVDSLESELKSLVETERVETIRTIAELQDKLKEDLGDTDREVVERKLAAAELKMKTIFGTPEGVVKELIDQKEIVPDGDKTSEEMLRDYYLGLLEVRSEIGKEVGFVDQFGEMLKGGLLSARDAITNAALGGVAGADMSSLLYDDDGSDNATAQKYFAVDQKIKSLAPLVILNRYGDYTPRTGISGWLESTGKAFNNFFGGPAMASLGYEPDVNGSEAAMEVIGSLSDLGLIDKMNGAHDLFTSAKFNHETGRFESPDFLTAESAGDLMGMVGAMAIQMRVGGVATSSLMNSFKWGRNFIDITKKGSSVTKHLDANKFFGKLAAKPIWGKTKLGTSIDWTARSGARMGYTGLQYEVAGQLFQSNEEEFNFGSGMLGSVGRGLAQKTGTGGKLLGGAIMKRLGPVMPGILGKETPSFIKTVAKYGSKLSKAHSYGVGETFEEFSQELYQIHRRADGDFFEQLDHQFGDLSEAAKFALSTYVMGMAMGSFSLGDALRSLEYKRALSKIKTDEERSIVKKIVKILTGEIQQSAEESIDAKELSNTSTEEVSDRDGQSTQDGRGSNEETKGTGEENKDLTKHIQELTTSVKSKEGMEALAKGVDKTTGNLINLGAKLSEAFKDSTSGEVSLSFVSSSSEIADLVKRAGEKVKEGQEPSAFIYTDGKGSRSIVVDASRMRGNTVFHEFYHPVLDVIKQTNLETYNQLVDIAKNKFALTVDGKQVKFKDWAEQNYQDKSQYTQENEMLTEWLAHVAAVKAVNKGTWGAMRDFFRAVAKFFGADLSDNNLIDLEKNPELVATQLQNAFAKGRGVNIKGAKKVEPEEGMELQAVQVFHGSPYQIDEFSAGHISEKNQMGYAHYFSDLDQVAKWYAENENKTGEKHLYSSTINSDDFIYYYQDVPASVAENLAALTSTGLFKSRKAKRYKRQTVSEVYRELEAKYGSERASFLFYKTGIKGFKESDKKRTNYAVFPFEKINIESKLQYQAVENSEINDRIKDRVGYEYIVSNKLDVRTPEQLAAELDAEERYKQTFSGRFMEDGDNYIFKHYSHSPKKSLEGRGSEGSLKTSREETSALNSVGGVTLYYTEENQGEAGVGNFRHNVKVPKDKVYVFNSDADGFYYEAKQRFNEKFPGQAFTPNHQVAWITKVANENGYEIVVAKWRRGQWRGQGTTALSPDSVIDTNKNGEKVQFQSQRGYDVGVDRQEQIQYQGGGAYLTDAPESKDEAVSVVGDISKKSEEQRIELVERVQKWMAKYDDNPFSDYDTALAAMNDIWGGTKGTPIPPAKLLRLSQPDGWKEIVEDLSKLSPKQIEMSIDGLNEAKAIREYYESGQATPEETSLYYLWNILSSQSSVFDQEGGFLHAVDNGVTEWVTIAREGKWNEEIEKEYIEWANATLDGTPVGWVKDNLRNFSKFLRRGSDVLTSGPFAGKTRIDALHELVSDSKYSARDIMGLTHVYFDKMAFDNKIQAFAMLVTGRTDMPIFDRVRFNDAWDSPRDEATGKRENIYDGKNNNAHLAQLGNGIRGIALYDATKAGIEKNVMKAFDVLGIKDGSLGMWHWLTWVGESAQEASHGTLPVIQKVSNGESFDYIGVGKGKFADLDYGAIYMRTPDGFRFIWSTSDGSMYQLTNEQNKELKAEITLHKSRKLPKLESNERIVTYGFKNTKAKGKPWYELEGVNREALDQAIERHSEKPYLQTTHRKEDSPSGTVQFQRGAISAAPYRATYVESIDEAKRVDKSDAIKEYKSRVQHWADLLDIKISDIITNLGGYKNTWEYSITPLVDGDSEANRVFATLLGVMGPEIQESAVLAIPRKNGSADNLIVRVKPETSQELLDGLHNYNVGAFSFDLEKNTLYIYDVISEGVKVDELLKNEAEKISGKEKYKATVKFIGEESYAEEIRKFRDSRYYRRVKNEELEELLWRAERRADLGSVQLQAFDGDTDFILNRTAKRIATTPNADLDDLRADILLNPRDYGIHRTSFTEADQLIDEMSEAERIEIFEKGASYANTLTRTNSLKDNIGILAGIRLLNDYASSKQNDKAKKIFDQLWQMGSHAGLMLRQMAELKGSNAKAIEFMVLTQLGNLGLNPPSEEVFDELRDLAVNWQLAKNKLNNLKNEMNKLTEGDIAENQKRFDSLMDEIKEAFEEFETAGVDLNHHVNSMLPMKLRNIYNQVLQGNLLTAKSIMVNIFANIWYNLVPVRQFMEVVSDTFEWAFSNKQTRLRNYLNHNNFYLNINGNPVNVNFNTWYENQEYWNKHDKKRAVNVGNPDPETIVSYLFGNRFVFVRVGNKTTNEFLEEFIGEDNLKKLHAGEKLTGLNKLSKTKLEKLKNEYTRQKVFFEKAEGVNGFPFTRQVLWAFLGSPFTGAGKGVQATFESSALGSLFEKLGKRVDPKNKIRNSKISRMFGMDNSRGVSGLTGIEKYDIQRRMSPILALSQLRNDILYNRQKKKGGKLTRHKKLPIGPSGDTPLWVWASKFVEAFPTMGMHADVMFRLLSLGDVPFRYMAEVSHARRIASAKGIKDKAEFRDMLRNLTPAERKVIERAGDAATFADERLLSSIATKAFGFVGQGLDKINKRGGGWTTLSTVMGLVVKAAVPFVRIPANLMQSVFELAFPPISAVGVAYYAKKDPRKAGEHASKIILSAMLYYAAGVLYDAGLLVGEPRDDDDNDRVDAKYADGPNVINVSMMWRLANGIDIGHQVKDKRIEFYKAGIMGMFFAYYIKLRERLNDEGSEFGANFQTLIHAPLASLQSVMPQSFMANAFNMMQGFFEGDPGYAASEHVVTMTKTFIPNNWTAIQRSRRDEVLTSGKADDWLAKLDKKITLGLLANPDESLFLNERIYPIVDGLGMDVKMTKEGTISWWESLLSPASIKTWDANTALIRAEQARIVLESSREGGIPEYSQYGSNRGSGTIRVDHESFLDPDGNPLSINLQLTEGDQYYRQKIAGTLNRAFIIREMIGEDGELTEEWKKKTYTERVEEFQYWSGEAKKEATLIMKWKIIDGIDADIIEVDQRRRTYEWTEEPWHVVQVNNDDWDKFVNDTEAINKRVDEAYEEPLIK